MSREGDLRVSSRTWWRREQSEFLHYDKPASLLLSLSEKFLFHTGVSIPLDIHLDIPLDIHLSPSHYWLETQWRVYPSAIDLTPKP